MKFPIFLWLQHSFSLSVKASIHIQYTGREGLSHSKNRTLRQEAASTHQNLFQVKEVFVNVCSDTLTSYESVSDGLISTTDVNDFITEITTSTVDWKNFNGLAVELQLLWMWTLCPKTDPSISHECYDELRRMNERKFEYGLKMKEEIKDLIVSKVKVFCGKIWVHFREIGKIYHQDIQ